MLNLAYGGVHKQHPRRRHAGGGGRANREEEEREREEERISLSRLEVRWAGLLAGLANKPLAGAAADRITFDVRPRHTLEIVFATSHARISKELSAGEMFWLGLGGVKVKLCWMDISNCAQETEKWLQPDF